MNNKLIAYLLCPLLLCPMNSCYFNSTGRLIDRAQYEARATTADLATMPSPQVYTDGTEYYIELPRYRNGDAPQLQKSIFDNEPEGSAPIERRGMGLFRIPKNYALWLTGKGKKVNHVDFLEEVPGAAGIKARCTTMPIIRKGGDRSVTYTYRSPNAGLMYVAVPFNWLLVDLPVTVVENAAVAACIVGVAYVASMNDDEECDFCGGYHATSEH